MDRILELSEKRNALPWDMPWTRADEQHWLYSFSEAARSDFSRCARMRRTAIVPASRPRSAVREAVRSYRGVLDSDPSRSTEGFWTDSLPQSVEAKAIRRAGRSGGS